MHKKPLQHTMTSPIFKNQTLSVRVVSNKEKENVSPDVFLSPLEVAPTASSPENKSVRLTFKIPQIKKELIKPFVSELKTSQPTAQSKSISQEVATALEMPLELRKTCSTSTFDSVGSRFSLLTLANQQKGYQIPKDQEFRVLSDISCLFKTSSEKVINVSKTHSAVSDLSCQDDLPSVVNQKLDISETVQVQSMQMNYALSKQTANRSRIRGLCKHKPLQRRSSKMVGTQSRKKRTSMRV